MRSSGLLNFIFSYASVRSVLLAVIVGLVVYRIIQKRKYKLPPGPFSFPIIGHFSLYTNKLQYKEYLKLSKKYGPVLRINMGPFMFVYLNNIDVTLEAMVKKGAEFADRPSIASLDLVSHGGQDIAMGRYGPTWKLHRKIAGKALRQYMQGRKLEETVQAACSRVFETMSKEKGEFDPTRYCNLLVFNILCAFCFGKSYDLEDEEFVRIMEAHDEKMAKLGSGTLEDLFPFIARFGHSKGYREAETIVRKMEVIFETKMKEHKDTFDKNNIRDFTDSLILARREAEDEDNKELLSQLTETHLLLTLTDIFFGGIDTSRMTINWAVLHMAAFPDIQSKVQAELDAVVGKERFPGLQDREKLNYTEATLHESMRLNPAVTIGVPHSTMCDTSVGGYDIPKGTPVIINHWALLHDPDYWTDVDRFDPHRFLDSDGKLSPKPESWLPFSAGRRVCLGESVAKPELFLIFATMLQKYRFKLPSGVITKFEEDEDTYGGLPAKYKILIEDRSLLK